MRIKWTRECFRPRNVNADRTEPEGTDLEIITWEEGGKLYLMAFSGKAQKPFANYYYRTLEIRTAAVSKMIEDSRTTIEWKAARQKARRDFQHTLKVGDILKACWGYDQTNVDWYQVTEVKAKTITIREISGRTVEQNNMGQNMVEAVAGTFIGEPMKKRPSDGNVIKIESYMYAYPWNGQPTYETAFGWGH